MLRGYGESDVTFCTAVQMAVEGTKENKQSNKSLLTNTYNRDTAFKIRDKLQKKGDKYHFSTTKKWFQLKFIFKTTAN